MNIYKKTIIGKNVHWEMRTGKNVYWEKFSLGKTDIGKKIHWETRIGKRFPIPSNNSLIFNVVELSNVFPNQVDKQIQKHYCFSIENHCGDNIFMIVWKKFNEKHVSSLVKTTSFRSTRVFNDPTLSHISCLWKQNVLSKNYCSYCRLYYC